MNALPLVITDAGRAAIAQVGQVGPVKIDKIALGSSGYSASAAQEVLESEIKQLPAKGSIASGSGMIHITTQDNSHDSYTVREVGVMTSDGVLFAVYSQETEIFIKRAGNIALLAFDFAIKNVPAESIVVGNAEFEYPPATESIKGVAKIATQDEVNSGSDDSTIVTPVKLSKAIQHLITPEKLSEYEYPSATEDKKGIAKIATQSEVDAGFTDSKIVTPLKLSNWKGNVSSATQDKEGVARIATQSEVDAGFTDSKIVTPLKLSKWKGNISSATQDKEGVARIATQWEVDTGFGDNKIVTPLKLSNWKGNVSSATEEKEGIAKIATQSEVDAGYIDNKFVSPFKLSKRIKEVTDSISGARNLLINGSFCIDQRFEGKPKTITTIREYCIDRWFAYIKGYGLTGVTGQRILNAGGYGYQFMAQQNDGQIVFGQRIETDNCLNLGQETCSLSFKVFSSKPVEIGVQVEAAYKRDDWWWNTVRIASKKVQVANDGYTYGYHMRSSINAKASNGLIVSFEVPLVANNKIVFSDIQFEKGTQATPFEYRPVGTELSLCQRYYERLWGYFDGNMAHLDQYLRQLWTFCTPKRTKDWTYKVKTNVRSLNYPKFPGFLPAIISPGGFISKLNEKQFITQIQATTNNEWGWEIEADAEL